MIIHDNLNDFDNNLIPLRYMIIYDNMIDVFMKLIHFKWGIMISHVVDNCRHGICKTTLAIFEIKLK